MFFDFCPDKPIGKGIPLRSVRLTTFAKAPVVKKADTT